jgi:hypothetical protein
MYVHPLGFACCGPLTLYSNAAINNPGNYGEIIKKGKLRFTPACFSCIRMILLAEYTLHAQSHTCKLHPCKLLHKPLPLLAMFHCDRQHLFNAIHYTYNFSQATIFLLLLTTKFCFINCHLNIILYVLRALVYSLCVLLSNVAFLIFLFFSPFHHSQGLYH